MNKLKLNFLLVAIASCFCLVGCNNDDEGTSLDQQLTTALTTASNGQGASFYTLPSETDFASIPQDPLNPITTAKVELGQMLYHETAIGLAPRNPIGQATYSCASCHHVQAGFQAGMAQGIGDGGTGFGLRGEARTRDNSYQPNELDVQDVRSPTTLNVAYQTNMLWNGQFGATGVNIGTEAQWTPGTPKADNNLGFEGVEIQAAAGQNVHRLVVDSLVGNPQYEELFAQAYPNIAPNERITRVNAALAIAAYERTLLSNQAPFQRWLKGETNAMTDVEKRGAVLFFGEAECYTCHNGPALNSMEFHALGMNDLDQLTGVFNVGPDAIGNKGRGGFTTRPEDMFKFKVPQLYNLKDSPFYGHGGSFNTIEDVIRYKNTAQAQNSRIPASQLADGFVPLNLSEDDITALKQFLENSLYDASLTRYVPSTLPTGLCFPNNDIQSKTDLGCN